MSNEEQVWQSCLDAALRCLAYRPHSEAELRTRLKQRGFIPAVIQKTILKLKEQGLVNDAAFARFWKENRESFRPRSRRVLEWELKQKQVSPEFIQAVFTDWDEESSAYQAAQKKLKALTKVNYTEFHHRLTAFLRQRGFSYEVVRRTVSRLCEEQKEENV